MSIDTEMEMNISEFLKLFERKTPDTPLDLMSITKYAHLLHENYPNRIEPLFYLLRTYRIASEYEKAWKLIKEIEDNAKKGLWEGPREMWVDEIIFEKSLLSFHCDPESTDFVSINNNQLTNQSSERQLKALRYSIDYLNLENPINWEYIYENLVFLCHPLCEQLNSKLYKMNLPKLGNYHASSISHVWYKEEDCLCVRYVNYKINPKNGIYDCNEFNSTNLIMYGDKMEIVVNEINLPIYETVYHGIEDCRLYVDISGCLRFICTQQQYVPGNMGTNLMLDGVVDIDNFTFKNGCILGSPDENYLCEKNWIPWVSPRGILNYIYWWYPFQVGRLDKNNKLEIVHEQKVPHLFKTFRGSTCFVPWKNLLCGLVHFVHTPMDGVGTRRYYHCMIFLEIVNDLPYVFKYTLPFTFLTSHNTLDRGCIEYCIGFNIRERNSDDAVGHFWFSYLDSDPHKIELPMHFFETIIV